MWDGAKLIVVWSDDFMGKLKNSEEWEETKHNDQIEIITGKKMLCKRQGHSHCVNYYL